MVSFYEEQRRINVFLEDKIKALTLGSIKKLEINALIIELTTKHAISEKYILKRINLLLSIYTDIENKNGVLRKND